MRLRERNHALRRVQPCNVGELNHALPRVHGWAFTSATIDYFFVFLTWIWRQRQSRRQCLGSVRQEPWNIPSFRMPVQIEALKTLADLDVWRIRQVKWPFL